MGNYVNRDTLEYRRSVNDPHYPDPPWLYVPPGSDNEAIILRATEERLTNRIELHEQRIRHALEAHVLREHPMIDLRNDDLF